MKPTKLAVEKVHLRDGDPIDELRHSYPELDFVFDKLEELRQTVDELLDKVNELEDD